MIDKTAVRRRPVKKHAGKSAVKRKRPNRRPRTPLSRSDRFTILWLVLFFPVGLSRMWQSKCRWSVGLKYALSGLCAALCVAIIVVPSPYKKNRGGIEMVADDPEVEIYGPSAPSTLVDGYTTTQQESVVVDSVSDSSTNVTVYAAEGAECYHLGDCKFAYASAKKLTVYEAYFLGYRPCGACNPPVYDPVTGLTTEQAVVSEDTEDSAAAGEESESASGEELDTSETDVIASDDNA